VVTVARIDGATRTLGKSQGFLGLPIRDVEIDGVSAMISAWEFTPAEIAAINAGGKLYIFLLGKEHPPMKVGVEKIL